MKKICTLLMLACICVAVASCGVSADDVGYEEVDVLSDTSYEYFGDTTYADWSEYCTAEPIYTELYSVIVPESWRDICKYDILGSGLGIDFLVRFPDGDNVPLCTLNVYLDGALLNNYDLLGTAKDTYGTSYSLIATYPGDIQWEDDYEREIYLNVVKDIKSMFSSMTPTDGCTLDFADETSIVGHPALELTEDGFGNFDYENVTGSELQASGYCMVYGSFSNENLGQLDIYTSPDTGVWDRINVVLNGVYYGTLSLDWHEPETDLYVGTLDKGDYLSEVDLTYYSNEEYLVIDDADDEYDFSGTYYRCENKRTPLVKGETVSGNLYWDSSMNVNPVDVMSFYNTSARGNNIQWYSDPYQEMVMATSNNNVVFKRFRMSYGERWVFVSEVAHPDIDPLIIKRKGYDKVLIWEYIDGYLMMETCGDVYFPDYTYDLVKYITYMSKPDFVVTY